MKKTYSKTGTSCQVTFELPAEINAKTVALCGDFNEWETSTHLMKQRKDGSYTRTVSLKPGKEYRFRYLIDGERWENDWDADKYIPNEFATEDSVVIV